MTICLVCLAAISFCYTAEQDIKNNNGYITRRIIPRYYPRGEMRKVFATQIDESSIIALFHKPKNNQAEEACFVYCHSNKQNLCQISINPKHALSLDGYTFNEEGSLFCMLSKQEDTYDLLTFSMDTFRFRLHRVDSFLDETISPSGGKKTIFFNASTLCLASLKQCNNRLMGCIYAITFLKENCFGLKTLAHVSTYTECKKIFFDTSHLKNRYQLSWKDIAQKSLLWNPVEQKYETAHKQ